MAPYEHRVSRSTLAQLLKRIAGSPRTPLMPIIGYISEQHFGRAFSIAILLGQSSGSSKL